MGMRSSAPGFLAAATVALLVFGGFGSEASVHRVGDSAGWTIIGNVSYSDWASSKAPFRKGDTLVFVYNKQFHNVLEVTKAAYRACDATSPIAAYSSGNDTLTIKHMGHTFFICGFPGHCQLGQKLDVRVPKILSSALPPSGAAAAGAPAGGPVSAAAEGGASVGLAPAAAASHGNRNIMIPSAFIVTWTIICGLLYNAHLY